MRFFLGKPWLLFVAPLFIGPLFAEKTVIIHASTFTLELYDDMGTLIKTYPVGLGKGGMGKTKIGDKKTPIGTYHVQWKASSLWETDGGFAIKEGQSYCSSDSSFIQEYQKGADPLWGDDFGGEKATFLCLNYPNNEDMANGFTGSGIGIHGTLLGGIQESASSGCIRMHVEDAQELYKKLDIGDVVHIQMD